MHEEEIQGIPGRAETRVRMAQHTVFLPFSSMAEVPMEGEIVTVQVRTSYRALVHRLIEARPMTDGRVVAELLVSRLEALPPLHDGPEQP